MRLWLAAVAVASLSAALTAQNTITPPIRTVAVEPHYTPSAMRARIYGEVVLKFDVLTDGTTANFEVVKSLDAVFGLDQQAIEAVKQWRFKPATKDGAPVIVRVTANLNFALRDRDGTMLGGPPAAVSTWPDSFANDIADAGATWKPGSVNLGDITMRFESPAGWHTATEFQNQLRLAIISGDGRRAVMTGAARKTPGPMPLPLPPDRLEAFGKTMSTRPEAQKAPILASGQVQIGTQWWLWLELTPGADLLEQMPPEMRSAMSTRNFSDLRLWSFVTGHGNEMVQIMFLDWLPESASDRDAELKSATSVFRVVLSKVSFSEA